MLVDAEMINLLLTVLTAAAAAGVTATDYSMPPAMQT